jgi:CheY-like chemotaxis protein/two-component sensor histidine kinase
MANLTNQLLAYAQGGKYFPQKISFSEFVESTLPTIRHTISPSIKVETDLPGDISCVEADLTQMQMVLSAALTNSEEAMDGQGRIRIIVRDKDIDEEFAKHHPGLKPGRYVCLTIEDNGKGMDKGTRMRVFEPFFSTKFQGRGLGMAAAYGIVRNHDGWLSLYSELGQGTVVRIYLPAIEDREKEVKEPRIEPIKGTGTILVIEDEETVMDVSRTMLERLGYRILEANTGEKAVEIAKSFDGVIDLAILDIVLPDMPGKKIYPLIMEARPNLKVLVCSGYSIDGPAKEILDAGAQDFIQKPFSLAALSEKLKDVLEAQ